MGRETVAALPCLVRALRCTCLRCGYSWIAPRAAHPSALDDVAASVGRRLDSGGWKGEADLRALAQILMAAVDAARSDGLPLPDRCAHCRTHYWDVPLGSRRRGRPSLLLPRDSQRVIAERRARALREERL